MIFHIQATDVGKKYAQEWIFKGFTKHFAIGQVTIVTGNNGSGKSTLLKTLAGMQPYNQGKIQYARGKALLNENYWFTQLSYAAPYLQVVEEFTLKEMLEFQAKFKEFLLPTGEILDKIGLPQAAHKPIKYFSSGMKQKCKLALALFAKNPALFLDEPTSNFDKNNTVWYQQELSSLLKHQEKTVIIASNDSNEYEFLSHYELLKMEDYKFSKKNV
jgi:ABC-type multidrug transport system ATPase subunit